MFTMLIWYIFGFFFELVSDCALSAQAKKVDIGKILYSFLGLELVEPSLPWQTVSYLHLIRGALPSDAWQADRPVCVEPTKLERCLCFDIYFIQNYCNNNF